MKKTPTRTGTRTDFFASPIKIETFRKCSKSHATEICTGTRFPEYNCCETNFNLDFVNLNGFNFKISKIILKMFL